MRNRAISIVGFAKIYSTNDMFKSFFQLVLTIFLSGGYDADLFFEFCYATGVTKIDKVSLSAKKEAEKVR